MTDRPVGSSGGPSLRRRLDRAGGEGESRAEVLARDPLHYVKVNTSPAVFRKLVFCLFVCLFVCLLVCWFVGLFF